MDRMIIKGGRPLRGSVKISGSKNASLPIMCASLLLENNSIFLKNVPDLRDIRTLSLLLEHLGVQIERKKGTLVFTTKHLNRIEAPYDIVRKMRASVLVLGPLLAVKGRARVSLPGGCSIGARPINLHLDALEKMGATIRLEKGYVEGSAPQGLKGAEIHFEKKSVGATENVILAGSLAKGKTVIHNAAMEPEIVDLADALIAMGADIEGAGTPTITIYGKKILNGTTHTVIPDRIEAATFLIAAAATRGELTVTHCNPTHLTAPIDKLREAGATITISDSTISIKAPNLINSVDITTSEYPGFPTDLQAQFMVLNLLGNGISMINETIFENRFMHVQELMRMGANIRVEGNTAIVPGKIRLGAASVMATDLRASASLVIAALVAKGESEVLRVYHLDRGYEKIERKLRALGANIRRAKGKNY